jgi:hypothetical protein
MTQYKKWYNSTIRAIMKDSPDYNLIDVEMLGFNFEKAYKTKMSPKETASQFRVVYMCTIIDCMEEYETGVVIH